jgi:adenylylsulfate kinase
MEKNNGKGLVIWLYGLSGAGKTTLSKLLSAKLRQDGLNLITLDGDDLRNGLNSNLSFSMKDREENIRRAAEMAKIISINGLMCICSFITPLNSHRQLAKKIIGENYFDVFVNCPIKVCQGRDVKGLYKKAFESSIKDFTGLSSKFEKPNRTDLKISTHLQSPEESLDILYLKIINRIKLI